MKWIQLCTAKIPDSDDQLTLSQCGDAFSICLSGVPGELMHSREHSSEEALAELGCAHLATSQSAHVVVGGLGMGFTLASALKTLPSSAEVTVAELVPEVVDWNKGPLGKCAGQPLLDSRTCVHIGDVASFFYNRKPTFDAVLLDVDNGPDGITHIDNNGLYSTEGLEDIYDSLRSEGMLAIWSAGADQLFTIRLKKVGFKVKLRTVRARNGKGRRHTIFLAQKPWSDN